MTETIGRYQIIRELGHGGMGVVYLAYDPHLDRQVVIKKILYQEHDKTRLQHSLQRFRREAKAIANLDHPAIVPIYDYGVQDNQPYLIMKYVGGGSLADRLRQSALRLPEINRILQAISPAIDYIHSKQIVHRDLKPANILFDENNNPYLADFGLVKLLSGDSDLQTATDMMVGTPAYMSPEQVLAKTELDGLSDIYSLGVIFYQMLSGSPPYMADSAMGTAFMHVNEPIPDIRRARPDLSSQAQKLIGRALAKNKGERFQSAGELAAAAADLTLYEQQKTTRATAKLRLLAWLGIAGVGVLALASCLFLAASVFRTPEATVTATQAIAKITALTTATPTATRIVATATVPATPTATSTPSPTVTPTQTPRATPSIATPTETPSPTPTTFAFPVPRLVNHTDCQNNISVYKLPDTIEFQWTWTQRVDTENGFYLEIRVGPRGATNLPSTGAINNDALVIPSQNSWSVRVPVAAFFQETALDYHWQVAYVNEDHQLIVASSRGCINIR